MSALEEDWDHSQIRGTAEGRGSIEALDDEPQEPARTDRKRIGRYELCFELASGGMATVYLARALGPAGFEKLVALKRIHPHLAKNRRYINMFMDEARIASKISHANVCSVFDHGEVDGEFFIAMEYLVGEPLVALCRLLVRQTEILAEPRYPYLAARIIADAAEGLHAAHELTDARGQLMQVVHRDISPHNLFVSYDGVVRVVDFGIARAASRLQHTATGELKGKLAYMSPEQLNGSTIDRRTDVWALGVVLWELLVGRQLFRRGSPPDTIRAATTEPIAAPSSLRANVPREFDRIVLKALERRPSDRYPTARALAQDLLQASGAQGHSVGLGDLAALMDRLFPGGAARKRQLVTIASATDEVPVVHDPDPGSHSAVGTVSAKPSTIRSGTRRWRRLVGLSASGAGALAAFMMAYFDRTAVTPVRPAAPLPSHAQQRRPTEALEASPPQVAAAMPPPVESAQAGTAPSQTATTLSDEDAVERNAAPAEPRRRRDRTARVRRVAAEPSPPDAAPPSRETVAPPSPVPAAGTLSITTPGGWANVYDAEGRFLGATPLRRTLPASESA